MSSKIWDPSLIRLIGLCESITYRARVGTLNKTLKWKKERISKISIFENQKGKGYGNWKIFQKSKKEKRKGFFFAEIKKGKKERIFSENPERKGKMGTRALSNKTQIKTHTITIFLLFWADICSKTSDTPWWSLFGIIDYDKLK